MCLSFNLAYRAVGAHVGAGMTATTSPMLLDNIPDLIREVQLKKQTLNTIALTLARLRNIYIEMILTLSRLRCKANTLI